MRMPLRRPRSLRAKLVCTYTAAAVLLGLGGMAAFTVLLHRGVVASVDATLESRAAPLVSELSATQRLAPGTPPVVVPSTGSAAPAGAGEGKDSRHGAAAVESFSAIYRPDGRAAEVDPPGAAILTASELRSARAGQRAFTVATASRKLRVLAVPVRRADGTWVVAVGTDLGDVTGATNTAIRELELIVPALIVLAATGAWLLSGAALRPVKRMTADAADLGEHDPASRITVPATADELASLARTFNGLLDRLTRSLARQRDLIADAGHELRTPLAVLRTELELADMPGRSKEELADSVAHARKELDRLSKVADDLLLLARADGAGPLIHPVDTDLVDVATATIRAHRAHAESAGTDLQLVCPDQVPAVADPSALRRALDNLIANALTAVGSSGTVTVTITVSDVITLSVRDTGPGFPPEFVAHAFGRFTLPDSARSAANGGAGLGLAIVAEIVHAHGGSVSATNGAAGGADVTVTLPLGRPGAQPPPRSRRLRSRPSAAGTSPVEEAAPRV